MSTDVVTRTAGLDLTRAPTEQWNEEMMKLVASQVLKRASTKGEQVYCLVVADSLGLNPFIDEIYFLPTKSKDGSGPGIKPYIGRNGLVKKAAERDAYYESETVHEHDRFRMSRAKDGTVSVTHSYGVKDRGEIVGAYAWLHFRNGDKPAFAYAKLSEYLPTFDADWKMGASPWGNQRSAMIEKCAMIMAGRKRLNLGGVLVDGEIARFEQQQAITGPPPVEAEAFEFSALDASEETIAELEAVVDRLNTVAPLSWTPAKCEMVMSGMHDVELRGLLTQLREEANELERRAESRSPVVPGPGGEPQAPESGSVTAPGSDGEGHENVTDAVVVPDEEHVAALAQRAAGLEERLQAADPASDEAAMLSAELDGVNVELDAATNPDQGQLL